MSVAEGPWLYGLKATWCYFVRGSEIDRGSDGEPLLDVNSVRVAGAIMERRQLFKMFCARNRDRLCSVAMQKGVDPIKLFALFLIGWGSMEPGN